MHLYLFLRGKVEQVHLWESHVQAQYFKFRRINLKTKEPDMKLVQLGLRHSVLGAYELVFPKEALTEVLAMLGAESIQPAYDIGLNSMRLVFLRAIFGAEMIRKKTWKEAAEIARTRKSITINNSERGLSDCIIPGTAVHVIGVKRDAEGSVDNQYSHELL